MEEVKVGLVKGRHEMPVKGYLFKGEIDPMDFAGMYLRVAAYLACHIDVDQRLVVYVTGLTAATAAVIKACAERGVPLTLMHYNRETGSYVPQQIF